MTKQKFINFEASIKDRGYTKYNQQLYHADYILCKSFHKEDNKWEDGRAAYQIIIAVYDWSDETKDIFTRLPSGMQNKVGLEVHVDMSRIIDERLELVFAFNDNDTIEEVERIAEEYYQAMCKIIPKPREYEDC
jgi:hypothetical protein